MSQGQNHDIETVDVDDEDRAAKGDEAFSSDSVPKTCPLCVSASVVSDCLQWLMPVEAVRRRALVLIMDKRVH